MKKPFRPTNPDTRRKVLATRRSVNGLLVSEKPPLNIILTLTHPNNIDVKSVWVIFLNHPHCKINETDMNELTGPFGKYCYLTKNPSEYWRLRASMNMFSKLRRSPLLVWPSSAL